MPLRCFFEYFISPRGAVYRRSVGPRPGNRSRCQSANRRWVSHERAWQDDQFTQAMRQRAAGRRFRWRRRINERRVRLRLQQHESSPSAAPPPEAPEAPEAPAQPPAPEAPEAPAPEPPEAPVVSPIVALVRYPELLQTPRRAQTPSPYAPELGNVPVVALPQVRGRSSARDVLGSTSSASTPLSPRAATPPPSTPPPPPLSTPSTPTPSMPRTPPSPTRSARPSSAPSGPTPTSIRIGRPSTTPA